MEEWEIFFTDEVGEFLEALYASDRESHKLVNQAILVLERNGPAEGRPLVDSITGSKIPNMKNCGLAPPAVVRSVSCSSSIRGGRPSCWSPETRQATGNVGIGTRSREPSTCTRFTWWSGARR